MPKVKKLRTYQEETLEWAFRMLANPRRPHLLIGQPPGAGKSMQAHLISRFALECPNFGIKKVLVLTPLIAIRFGFSRDRDYDVTYVSDSFSWLHNGGVRPLNFQTTDGALLAMLQTDRVGAYIACHASLANAKAEDSHAFEQLSDCSDLLIVVDEAHHLNADNNLTSVVQCAVDKGARMLLLTATPFVATGPWDFIIKNKTKARIRPLSQHIEEGFAPQLENEIAYSDIWPMENGLPSPEFIARRTIETFLANDRVKSLVVIPATPSCQECGTTEAYVDKIIDECHKIVPPSEISLLNTLGESKTNIITRECCGETYHDIQFTAPTGKYREGVDDARLACIQYFVRPKSANLSVQISGRILRKKSDEYLPEQFRSKSKQIFHTSASSDNLIEFSCDVLKYILRTENPLAAATLPPIKTVINELRMRRRQADNSGDIRLAQSYAEFADALEDDAETTMCEALADLDAQVTLAYEIQQGATLPKLIQQYGMESNVAKLAMYQQLKNHPNKLLEHMESIIERRAKNHKGGKHKQNNTPSFEIADFYLHMLAEQYADEEIDQFITTIDNRVLTEWSDRWEKIRDRTDLEKAESLVQAFSDGGLRRDDRINYPTYEEFRLRNLLSTVLPTVKRPSIDALAVIEKAGLSIRVFADNWNDPLVCNNGTLLTLQRFVPLASWVKVHGRKPQLSSDPAERSAYKFYRIYKDKMTVVASQHIASIIQELHLGDYLNA